jgi:O-6-methylguanine DNA methyltransferase
LKGGEEKSPYSVKFIMFIQILLDDKPTITLRLSDNLQDCKRFFLEDGKMTFPSLKIYLGELDHTLLGDLRIAVSDLGLVAVEWADSQPELDAYLLRLKKAVERDQKMIEPYMIELEEYLNGKRREFTFAIDWSILKPFQLKTLKAVYAIPYGETQTYADIAIKIGHPHAYRAVGRANAANPMPLVIPCHRVIGRDGKLHGYGGGDGLPTKEWLLKMEGAMIA